MKKKYLIEVFKIGFPGEIIKIFRLTFDSIIDATTFAESIISEGEGFIITD